MWISRCARPLSESGSCSGALDSFDGEADAVSDEADPALSGDELGELLAVEGEVLVGEDGLPFFIFGLLATVDVDRMTQYHAGRVALAVEAVAEVGAEEVHFSRALVDRLIDGDDQHRRSGRGAAERLLRARPLGGDA